MVELTAEQLQALRIIVAEELGWSVKHHTMEAWDDTPPYQLIPPGDMELEDEWFPTEEAAKAQYPDYPGSDWYIGEMLSHFQAIWNDYKDPSEYRNWSLGSSTRDGLWMVAIRDWDAQRLGYGEASTPELAIALAIAEYVKGKGN